MPARETIGRAAAVAAAAVPPLLLAGVVLVGFGSSGAEGPFSERGADGAELYRRGCASCHGLQGEGGVGPAMDGVTARYPDIDDHIDIVANGLGEMPAFGAVLTDEEILAVVEFQREVLDG